jgi:hypothetical protein
VSPRLRLPSRSLRVRAGHVVLLMAYVGLLSLRMPEVFLKGRFGAEEGAVYFFNAWNQPCMKRSLLYILAT